jgi:hypothetical protein
MDESAKSTEKHLISYLRISGNLFEVQMLFRMFKTLLRQSHRARVTGCQKADGRLLSQGN